MQKNLYRKPFITAIRHQLKISTNTPGLEERSFLFSLSFTRIMEVVRRREEVGAVVLLVAVIEGQQIGHGLVWSVYVSFGHPC